MRLAIFSDVHGNLEALQVVLGKIAELQVDRIICLGDVAGVCLGAWCCRDCAVLAFGFRLECLASCDI